MAELWATPQIADDLGITRQHVVNLIKSKVLSAVKDERGHYRLDPDEARRQYAEHRGLDFSRRWDDHAEPTRTARDLSTREWLSIVSEVDSWFDWGARVELLNCAFRITRRACEVEGLPDGARAAIRDAVREEIYSSLRALESFDGTICADMPQRAECPRFGSAETCEVIENGGDCYGGRCGQEAVCLADVLHFAEYFEDSDTWALHDPINPHARGMAHDLADADRAPDGGMEP